MRPIEEMILEFAADCAMEGRTLAQVQLGPAAFHGLARRLETKVVSPYREAMFLRLHTAAGIVDVHCDSTMEPHDICFRIQGHGE